ncbi:hypothetical protein C1637_11545 [Chryseobacterium lactis]|uniref:Uncharacterized protein n=1 Tax=Chryseobacterium lactis TaxID=1241981 RepID=A0A3G6RWB0_CHRLC|nr:hypothetical protein [Chryseobacterium lactis]AZA80828.1 hypothetical protein EG342_02395 [Chryseobacterium lactis]AZB05830.1 hypothetical protein EG341_18520 [Chryseobacterium lactis]PNW13450.1 hypothetical protein C1637_11545 [Chryseobacterium lactis]
MKKVFISLLLFMGITVFSQEKFDCNNLSKTDYLNKYYQLRNYGLNYKFKDGTEVIPVLISKIFDENNLRQICIDTAYQDHKFGTENSYKLFRDNIQNISREVFMNDYDYFQIFLKMITHLESNSNYIRTR